MTPPPLQHPSRPTRWDWLLVGALVLVTVLPYLTDALLVLIGLAQVLPLAWRRVSPVPVFFVVALATLAQVPVSDNFLPFDVALLFALYAVVAWVTDRRLVAAAILVCAIGSLVAGLDWAGAYAGDVGRAIAIATAMCLAMVAATAALGLAARRRRELLAQLHARALDAERERDQHALLAAQTERTRIAREMHDVIAHALAVIVVQSDGAGYAVHRSGSPEQAAAALETIGSTSRAALAETRRLVGALREEGESPELMPSSGASDIPDLVEGVRAAGLDVELRLDGLRRDDLAGVSPAAGAAAYRVVQESLTNVIKHAGPQATATVDAARSDDTLRLTISDNGRGLLPGADAGRGYGIVGMRERVGVLGGRLRTGARTGGGFTVTAEIPYEKAQPGGSSGA